MLGEDTDLGPMRSDMLGLTSTESGGAGVGGSPTDVLEGGGCGLRVGMVGSVRENTL